MTASAASTRARSATGAPSPARSGRHRLALAYIDLDELPRPARRPADAVTRPGLLRFRRRDYLGDPRSRWTPPSATASPSSAAHRPDGPIRLLTQLRSYGLCFNPVSFYYCLDARRRARRRRSWPRSPTPRGASATPTCCAATPMSRPGCCSGRFAKELHVSPFMGMDHVYEARATAPGPTLSVHIESRRGGTDGVRRDAGDAAPRADPGQRGPDVSALSAGHGPRPGADLRPRGRPQARRRPRPPPSPGGSMTAGDRPGDAAGRAVRARGGWRPRCCCARSASGASRSSRAGRRRVFGSGPPVGHHPCALAAVLADADAGQPRTGRVLRAGDVGLARSGRRDPAGRSQRGADRPRARAHGAAVGAALSASAPLLTPQHPPAQPPRHRRPLRPRQRAVRADARPDDDVLVRAVRA